MVQLKVHSLCREDQANKHDDAIQATGGISHRAWNHGHNAFRKVHEHLDHQISDFISMV